MVGQYFHSLIDKILEHLFINKFGLNRHIKSGFKMNMFSAPNITQCLYMCIYENLCNSFPLKIQLNPVFCCSKMVYHCRHFGWEKNIYSTMHHDSLLNDSLLNFQNRFWVSFLTTDAWWHSSWWPNSACFQFHMDTHTQTLKPYIY